MNTLTRIVLLSALWSAAAFADDWKLIVHPANPISTVDREKVARYFLKKATRWEGGDVVVPVEQADGATHDAFCRQVIDKSPAAVKSYWQQLIFSGREVPPPQKQGDQEVIEFVKSRAGAIGYVSAGASTEGVKVVKVEGAKP